MPACFFTTTTHVVLADDIACSVLENGAYIAQVSFPHARVPQTRQEYI